MCVCVRAESSEIIFHGVYPCQASITGGYFRTKACDKGNQEVDRGVSFSLRQRKRLTNFLEGLMS